MGGLLVGGRRDCSELMASVRWGTGNGDWDWGFWVFFLAYLDKNRFLQLGLGLWCDTTTMGD